MVATNSDRHQCILYRHHIQPGKNIHKRIKTNKTKNPHTASFFVLLLVLIQSIDPLQPCGRVKDVISFSLFLYFVPPLFWRHIFIRLLLVLYLYINVEHSNIRYAAVCVYGLDVVHIEGRPVASNTSHQHGLYVIHSSVFTP